MFAELFRGNLVRRDAAANSGALGFLRMNSGQEGGAPARMVAGTIAERAAIYLRQSAQDDHLVAERLQRLHRRRELEPGTLRWRESTDP